ncbi:hypothetical protein F5X68DRAFT_50227 [Plectosphaerella plurivora]|uniref:Uncharacterized protein n=1 Tax=Plectosphaerella plurivora TaxID=936078 RepID=A0A9P9A659_9PEZI|nr:hypothetical protein F5X68DRAFT_50227 [Plectosphaerella plurivora]
MSCRSITRLPTSIFLASIASLSTGKLRKKLADRADPTPPKTFPQAYAGGTSCCLPSCFHALCQQILGLLLSTTLSNTEVELRHRSLGRELPQDNGPGIEGAYMAHGNELCIAPGVLTRCSEV